MSKWLWGVVIAIVLISGCTGQQVSCEAPNVMIDSKCCLDANSNGICDSDETAQQSQPSVSPACGDGTCSSAEDCKYDSSSDRYVTSCPDDCGTCPAFIIMSSSHLNPEELQSYHCTGYNEGVCTETGGNKFTLDNKVGPYDKDQRGFFTYLKNVGEGDATNIQSSFKCYDSGNLSMQADKDIYKGVAVSDYFWDRSIFREKIDTMISVTSEKSTAVGRPEWYQLYYLQFDIHDVEEDFDLECDVTLSSESPSWSNTQKLVISFVK